MSRVFPSKTNVQKAQHDLMLMLQLAALGLDPQASQFRLHLF